MFALKKQPDRDFIVLNITDPQLTGREWESGGREKQILTYTIDELEKRTSPDLIKSPATCLTQIFGLIQRVPKF